MDLDFINPKRVYISQGRWHVFITVLDSANRKHTFVASADSYVTEDDRIWFGTEEEYEGIE